MFIIFSLVSSWWNGFNFPKTLEYTNVTQKEFWSQGEKAQKTKSKSISSLHNFSEPMSTMWTVIIQKGDRVLPKFIWLRNPFYMKELQGLQFHRIQKVTPEKTEWFLSAEEDIIAKMLAMLTLCDETQTSQSDIKKPPTICSQSLSFPKVLGLSFSFATY